MDTIQVLDYVKVIEDNDPSGRYNGKTGVLTAVQLLNDPVTYTVEIDVNSGDFGTCIAKEIAKASTPQVIIVTSPTNIEQG